MKYLWQGPFGWLTKADLLAFTMIRASRKKVSRTFPEHLSVLALLGSRRMFSDQFWQTGVNFTVGFTFVALPEPAPAT